MIKALLDSGGSTTLVTAEAARNLQFSSQKDTTTFVTIAGNVQTNGTAKMQFTLPEFHDDRSIEWDVHITK